MEIWVVKSGKYKHTFINHSKLLLLLQTQPLLLMLLDLVRVALALSSALEQVVTKTYQIQGLVLCPLVVGGLTHEGRLVIFSTGGGAGSGHANK